MCYYIISPVYIGGINLTCFIFIFQLLGLKLRIYKIKMLALIEN
jgi:hypothetical protein